MSYLLLENQVETLGEFWDEKGNDNEASSPLLILFLSQVKDHDMSFILNKKRI